MQYIPIQPVPSQILSIVLNGQNCEIAIKTKTTGLFFDLVADGKPICYGRLCVDRVAITRNKATGFVGEFYFTDNQGAQNPEYTGLGGRYSLVYVDEQ